MEEQAQNGKKMSIEQVAAFLEQKFHKQIQAHRIIEPIPGPMATRTMADTSAGGRVRLRSYH